MADCTVVILTYKGKHHLQHLLPSLQAAIESYPDNKEIEVLIVDNGLDEPTRQYCLINFPNFRFEFSPVNDYLFSLNSYVRNLSSKYMFLLNDDMKLDGGIFSNIISLIKADDSLFAVTCNVMDWEGIYPTHGIRELSVKNGLLVHKWKDYKVDKEKLYYTLYPAGGAAIFNIEKFNQLGGFDPLFRPAYCEDADMGINAWYKGWPTIFSPKAIIYHREGGTINGQFEIGKLNRVQIRNTIIWSLKNNKVPFARSVFFLMLPYRLVFNLMKNRIYFSAILDALKSLKVAFKKGNTIRPVLSTEKLEILLKENFIIDNVKRN